MDTPTLLAFARLCRDDAYREIREAERDGDQSATAFWGGELSRYSRIAQYLYLRTLR